MLSKDEKGVELSYLNDFFETIYFGKGGPGREMTAKERVNVLFQTAREYRELLCHENELQNKRKTLFWSTQAGLCTAYYYIFLRREEITHYGVWLGETLLQLFLCVWGMISTVRFLRGLYYGARANRFLLFRWQAFIELYVSCVWLKEKKGINEKARACVDIPVSVTPFFPPVIGLADPREGLCSNDKESPKSDEENLLDCNEKSCAQVLKQIVNNRKRVNSKSAWYFDCKPGKLANWYKVKMHKCYDVLLIGWWAALCLYTIVNATWRIAAFEGGRICLSGVGVIGFMCLLIKLINFCKKNYGNFKLKTRATKLKNWFSAWLENESYDWEGESESDKETISLSSDDGGATSRAMSSD